MENTITITLTDEIYKELRKVALPPDDQEKLRIFEVKTLLAKAEQEVTDYKKELKELRKEK